MKNRSRREETEVSREGFGIHGGQFISETLMSAVTELEETYEYYKKDPQFTAELKYPLEEYMGRPSRLYYAEEMAKDLSGARVYLEREDLNHIGSHKINNALGQVLLAKKVGKARVIAETRIGQHGVATTTAAALSGLECEVYMGREDTDRQALNVYRMELLGAKVHPVINGAQTLKDVANKMLREQMNRVPDIHYVIDSVMGPHPFPIMIKDFRNVIGREIREQLMEKEGELPGMAIACMGGGSNAMGAFCEFIGEKDVKLAGYEVAGLGVEAEQTAATIATGQLGIFHDTKSYPYQDEYGQVASVYSILVGLDCPGIGSEHAQLHDSGRAVYVPVTDDEAADSSEYLSRMEGTTPVVESARTVAYVREVAGSMSKDQIIVINLSGREDKDVAAIARYKGVELYEQDTVGS